MTHGPLSSLVLPIFLSQMFYVPYWMKFGLVISREKGESYVCPSLAWFVLFVGGCSVGTWLGVPKDPWFWPFEILIVLPALQSMRLVRREKEALGLIPWRSALKKLRMRLDSEPTIDEFSLDRALDDLERQGETLQNLTLSRSRWLENQNMLDEAEDCLKRAILASGPSVVLVQRLSEIEFSNGKRDLPQARLEDFLPRRSGNLTLRRIVASPRFLFSQIVNMARNLVQAIPLKGLPR